MDPNEQDAPRSAAGETPSDREMDETLIEGLEHEEIVHQLDDARRERQRLQDQHALQRIMRQVEDLRTRLNAGATPAARSLHATPVLGPRTPPVIPLTGVEPDFPPIQGVPLP